jgi:nicotinamidase-related amidase
MLDVHSTVLMLIDLQVAMARAAQPRNNLGAEDRVAGLLSAWRAASLPVVHVRHISRSATSAFAAGKAGVEFQQAFAPLDHEHVVEKNVPDAFVHSGLERWLRVRNVQAVVIAGVATNNSVEATARTTGNLGFSAVVLSDGCFAFDKTDHDGRLRPAQEVHAMSLANLAGEYAQIAPTEAVLQALRVSVYGGASRSR